MPDDQKREITDAILATNQKIFAACQAAERILRRMNPEPTPDQPESQDISRKLLAISQGFEDAQYGIGHVQNGISPMPIDPAEMKLRLDALTR